MAFAKLKTLLRKAAACTYDDLWKAVGAVCDPRRLSASLQAGQCMVL